LTPSVPFENMTLTPSTPFENMTLTFLFPMRIWPWPLWFISPSAQPCSTGMIDYFVSSLYSSLCILLPLFELTKDWAGGYFEKDISSKFDTIQHVQAKKLIPVLQSVWSHTATFGLNFEPCCWLSKQIRSEHYCFLLIRKT
jgi:hypothetical protein